MFDWHSVAQRLAPDRLPAVLANMPKAELHIHIEGSLEPELIFALAKRNGVNLPYADVQSLRRAYAFTDLQSFLDIYYAGASVLLHEADFFDMAMAYFARAHADHVIHAELMFDPQTHTARGVSFATVINGLWRACEAARAQYGIESSLIMSFLRHLTEREAFETLEQALPFRAKIQAIGLDSSEQGHPPEKFARVYQRCRELGFRLTAHAGEEGPPAYIWSALDVLKVERIDHGVQALEDPQLIKALVERKVALTVCPLSNVKLCVFASLAEHNLKQMFAHGVRVTINSDDPAYFGGYLNANFLQTFESLSLDLSAAYTLARNSFEGSFASPAQRGKYIDSLQRWFSAL
jgi:adenine deaminase